MITPNPLVGTGLHAIGGISAASCYMPFEKVKSWSWEVFWIVQAMFAWLIMPLVIGYFTVPELFTVLSLAPSGPFWGALLLGSVYGFGGLSFGYAIRNIGYSLTYTLSIGISACLGTIIPMIVKGQVVEQFTQVGGGMVLIGMITSIMGVALCGRAGFVKEKSMKEPAGEQKAKFNMKKGLVLTIIAGSLSAVWGFSLEVGQPISDIAAEHGAGHFEGNAKLIVSSIGCLITNLTWFLVLTIKNGQISNLWKRNGLSSQKFLSNYLLSAFAGSMWYTQFFFYGLGHVRMGNFEFASWMLHMSMLIFFSYIIGVIMKEWKGVNKKTTVILILGLLILVTSFVLIGYGSYAGEMDPGGH